MATQTYPADTDLLSPELTEDPYGYLAALRETEPIHWNERHRAWFVTSYEDVRALLRERKLSSDAMTPYFQRRLTEDERREMSQTIDLLTKWMVYAEGGDHRRLRGVVQKAFSKDRIEALTDFCTAASQEAVAELVRRAQAEPSRPIDLVNEYADRLPGATILEMIGIPKEDRVTFSTWAEQLGGLINGVVTDPDRALRANAGVTAMVEYLDKLIEETNPSADGPLLGALLHAESEGQRLTRTEVMATCILLLDAGFKNTVRMISVGIRFLLEDSALLAELKADPELIDAFNEEVLRLEGPGKFLVRYTVDPLDYKGHEFPGGQRVFLSTAAANRDPSVFDNPDAVDLHRTENPHLAFGHGPHSCIGAPLSRLQGRIAIRAILDLLSEETTLAQRPSWAPGLLSRALESLDVEAGTLVVPGERR